MRNFGMIFGMEFSDNWSAIKFFTLVNKKNIRVNYPNKTVVVLSPSLCIEVQEIDEIMDSFHDVCSFI